MYKSEKRKKELKRQKKQEEKRQKKIQRDAFPRNGTEIAGTEGEPQENEVPMTQD